MFNKIMFFVIKTILLIILICAITVVYIFIDNNRVITTNYSVYSSKLPPAFNNYKIALIADFHNSNNSPKIIKAVKNSSPQIIVIIGDTINMDNKVFDNIGGLIDGLTQIAPVYLISGNNEIWSSFQSDFLTFVSNKGVNVINNKSIEIKHKNSLINLVGYGDIVYADEKMRMDILNSDISALYEKIQNKNLFSILLFHRAQYFESVAKNPFDLVLSAHTHGGQINLPFIQNGILMHKFKTDVYSKGYYRINDVQMIVSAGLEKNYLNPRILNTPEVVCVTLKQFN